MKDVRSKLGLFDPFPSYDVTVTKQVPLLCPLWSDPPPSPDLGGPSWMSPWLDAQALF